MASTARKIQREKNTDVKLKTEHYVALRIAKLELDNLELNVKLAHSTLNQLRTQVQARAKEIDSMLHTLSTEYELPEGKTLLDAEISINDKEAIARF